MTTEQLTNLCKLFAAYVDAYTKLFAATPSMPTTRKDHEKLLYDSTKRAIDLILEPPLRVEGPTTMILHGDYLSDRRCRKHPSAVLHATCPECEKNLS